MKAPSPELDPCEKYYILRVPAIVKEYLGGLDVILNAGKT